MRVNSASNCSAKFEMVVEANRSGLYRHKPCKPLSFSVTNSARSKRELTSVNLNGSTVVPESRNVRCSVFCMTNKT